ncbi:hypothetical protein [Halovulum sp. GXIMD14793]
MMCAWRPLAVLPALLVCGAAYGQELPFSGFYCDGNGNDVMLVSNGMLQTFGEPEMSCHIIDIDVRSSEDECDSALGHMLCFKTAGPNNSAPQGKAHISHFIANMACDGSLTITSDALPDLVSLLQCENQQ